MLHKSKGPVPVPDEILHESTDPVLVPVEIVYKDADIDPDETLHMQYDEVIALSKPLCLTKILGTPKMWIFLIVINLFYAYTIYTVVRLELFDLREIDSIDFFDQDDHRTTKYFVELKISESMEKYRSLFR
jgi:hypothetical protein